MSRAAITPSKQAKSAIAAARRPVVWCWAYATELTATTTVVTIAPPAIAEDLSRNGLWRWAITGWRLPGRLRTRRPRVSLRGNRWMEQLWSF